MTSPALFLIRLGTLVAAACGLVSCETLTGKPKFTITFHAQAGPEDPPKTMFPYDLEGRRRFFKIVPEVSQQNITAFHPFPSESGIDNGVALKLDFRGSAALDIITRTRKDEYLLTLVNGKPADYVVIDQPVSDGLITIWQGVPDAIIKEMEKKYPHIKGGKGPTMSADMEMSPTTKAEKRHAYSAEKAAEAAAKKEKGSTKREDLALPQVPEGGASNKLPLEGGFHPYPAKPGEEPPLPKP